MSRRRFEMFQYRHVLVRLRQGDTDRQNARSRLMGRRKVTALRQLSTERGWLSTDSPRPYENKPRGNPMNATTYVIGTALLLPFLSSCSADSAPSCHSCSADSSPTCHDPAVMTSASVKLTEWLDQKIINAGFAHVNATLVVGISASAPIGDLQGTQQCTALASAALREPDGTLHTTEPLSLEFLLAIGRDGEPQITLNEGSLLTHGGAFDATGSLLVKELQREE